MWSYNPKTKKMEWEPIQHVWIDHDNDLVDLTIGWTKHTKHGDVHEDETIHTNQKHPFLTVEAGFVPVSNLNVGMHLVEGNGQIAIIEDWLVIAGSQTMYNLTVQQDHTYTVGDGQFVVHNCGDVRTPGQASSELASGSTETRVASRTDAETVFRKEYLGQNLRNTTGMSDEEVKDLFGSTEGTYHWDDEFDDKGRLLNHAKDNPHGYTPHLQIHPYDGPTIRIFFGK